MFEKVLSGLSKKALQPWYDSPRMMTSNLGLKTTWILGISTSYGAKKSHFCSDKWLHPQFMSTYDVDIGNIHVVFGPKFEVSSRLAVQYKLNIIPYGSLLDQTDDRMISGHKYSDPIKETAPDLSRGRRNEEIQNS